MYSYSSSSDESAGTVWSGAAQFLPMAQNVEPDWREQQIRPGVRLLVQKQPSVKTLRFAYSKDKSPVQFFYCLSGRACISVEKDDGPAVTGQVRARKYAVSYVPGAERTSIAAERGSMRMLALLFSPEALQDLMCPRSASCHHSCCEPCGSSCRSCVRNLVDGAVQSAFHQEEVLPLPLEMTLQEIVSCPLLKSGLEQVFLEYKGMELLYNQLRLFDSAEEAGAGRITSAELAAAQTAYSILLHNMAGPPSLCELAKKVGLTHTRLNQLFRALHQDTVFGVLRQKRLECARKMLEDRRKSVTEVAYECGFATPSHFSRAFLERYGVQPKRYQNGFLAESPPQA